MAPNRVAGVGAQGLVIGNGNGVVNVGNLSTSTTVGNDNTNISTDPKLLAPPAPGANPLTGSCRQATTAQCLGNGNRQTSSGSTNLTTTVGNMNTVAVRGNNNVTIGVRQRQQGRPQDREQPRRDGQ